MAMPNRRDDDEPNRLSEELAAGFAQPDAQATIEVEEGTRQVQALKDELRQYIVAEINQRYATQREAAEALEVPDTYIFGLIHNARAFSLHYLIQLAHRLGIRVKFICQLTRCS